MAKDRDFMWENLPGVRKPLTTEESEKLGTIQPALRGFIEKFGNNVSLKDETEEESEEIEE